VGEVARPAYEHFCGASLEDFRRLALVETMDCRLGGSGEGFRTVATRGSLNRDNMDNPGEAWIAGAHNHLRNARNLMRAKK
jgi:hypothetical protein